MNSQELLEKLPNTRAISVFDSDHKISDTDWQALLEVAQNAPSSNGLEPWHLIQIDDKDLREKLIPLSPGMTQKLQTADKFIFFVATKQDENDLRHNKFEIHQWTEEMFEGFKARFKGLHEQLLDIDYTAWLERQTAIPMAQMMLAAQFLGIDATPMEGFVASQVGKILAEEDLLDLTKERLTTALAFGYRAEEPNHPRNRRPLSEIVRRK